ncbi:MAG: hypothetical protein EI684_02610 [Candidatus Viridilinea halotolerans]|uniref:Uncharacterized protein n=1 Tax=Candidatus Viridilinea halotolerans TaxID=2491704 RepID=A0A426U8M9_9CHLR|nr:MAG: hypothetical protein EI684_02610 [Candidatus Viridilinea halotolerans]
MQPPTDPAARLRLLEVWLPFVQAESERYGWQLAGPELEQLILLAAPRLYTAANPLTARAIIWHYRQQLHHN